VVKDQVVLSSLHRQFEELEPKIRAVHANDDEAEKLREKLRVLTSDDHVRNAQFLQELTRIVPKGAYLTTFRVRSGRVELEGFAASASELVPLLEKSPLFDGAQFTSPVTKVQNNEERFSLTTEIAK
jgi:general secretion pathway protein L